MVEHNLAKVGVAGSSPVFRSKKLLFKVILEAALVVELVDTQDLKSCDQQRSCGFKSRLGHTKKDIQNYLNILFLLTKIWV